MEAYYYTLDEKFEGVVFTKNSKMDEENLIELDLKRFRELEGNEIFQIMKLRQDIFVVEQQSAYSDMDVFDQDAKHLFVSTTEGEIVAASRIFKTKENTWHIGRVAVKLEYRRKGIARMMMNFAKSYILSNYHVESIHISAQPYLQRFYERYGFLQSSEEYIEYNIPHIDMKFSNVSN